MIIIKLSLP